MIDYIIVLYMERCPSGLRSWSWKPVTPQGAVGSNPTLSATTSCYQIGSSFFHSRTNLTTVSVQVSIYRVHLSPSTPKRTPHATERNGIHQSMWRSVIIPKLSISHVSHLYFLLFHYFYIFMQFLYKKNWLD